MIAVIGEDNTVKHRTPDQIFPDQTSSEPTKSRIIDESAGILLVNLRGAGISCKKSKILPEFVVNIVSYNVTNEPNTDRSQKPFKNLLVLRSLLHAMYHVIMGNN